MGRATDRSAPIDVVGLSQGIMQISAGTSGRAHTCALTHQGGVKCWGDNAFGQLGDGTSTDRLTPVDVVGFTSGVVTTSTGGIYAGHTCALTSSGGVKCWGSNGYGQLGDGTNINRYTPVDVLGLSSGVTAISLGGDFSCALTEAGSVKCWGRGGRTGDGTTSNRNTPVNVVGLSSGMKAVTSGDGLAVHFLKLAASNVGGLTTLAS